MSIYEPTDDERALSLVAHVSIFISCAGVFIAAVTWIYAHDRMPYAAFQAAQAVLYQLAVIIVFMFLLIATIVVALGILALTVLETPFTGDHWPRLFGAVINIGTGLPMIGLTALAYFYAVYLGYQSYHAEPVRIPGIARLANAISPLPNVEPKGTGR
jgi:uncharacterized Tic20 family protein